LLRRALTAVVLLAVFLAALFLLDRAWFAGLVGLVIAAAGHEWGRLARLPAAGALLYGAAAAALYAGLSWAWHPLAAGDRPEATTFVAAALFWLLVVPFWLKRGLAQPSTALLAVTGIVVLIPTGLAALSLAPAQLLLALGLVWIADTAAYLGGRAFGRHQLAPAISPGKTWEGVAAAAAATLIYAIICALPGAPLGAVVQGGGWVAYLAVVVVLCAVSIAGDLFESAVKRQAGAKDSGALLPGHGGVLDRIDSITSTLPIAALSWHWIANR
jgi:phosphatidate cytidylyltransferase